MGIDIGYSDVKVTFGTETSDPTKMFKFSSTIGITKSNEYIKDPKIYTYKGNSYYVGEDALALPSESLIDITDYANLEEYAPLFLTHAINLIGETPDIIVTGLSKAQIQNSGWFKEKLQKFTVNETQYNFTNVFVIPQGAGCKVCSDNYGLLFDGKKTEFTNVQNYIGVDGGFNTLDLYRVINGKTSASVFEGIEHEGVMKIASKVAKMIYEKHNKKITLHEAKEVLNTNVFKLRSERFDYTNEVKAIKYEYIKDLLALIESRYGDILDKCECIYFSGGASKLFACEMFNGIKIIVPSKNNEFLNSIGQFMFGQEKVRQSL